MEKIYADIELINGENLSYARRGYITDGEVKKIQMNILVDTGIFFLQINENIQEQMQFPVLRKCRTQLADGRVMELDLVWYVELRFCNRMAICSVLVLPRESEPVLGINPLGSMDVLIDHVGRKLIVNPAHPDMALAKTGKLV